MAVIFEMVKYHHQSYPKDIPLRIEEVAAHFDVSYVSGEMEWSLHTEYSYGKRKLTQKRLTYYNEILGAQKDGVPQLWKNERWAQEFADYIVTLVGERRAPKVIEIHPPFNDYTDMDQFLSDYSVFETSIQKQFPETQILIENRCGSVYRGGKFLVSKNQDIELLCEGIDRNKLALQIAYDIPQIYTAHNAKVEKHYIELLSQAKAFRSYIGGVHLWGKKLSSTGRKVAHNGDLDTYFGDPSVKASFLEAFVDCFDDSTCRKMLLEVNSGNDDLRSIVTDLRNTRIQFV